MRRELLAEIQALIDRQPPPGAGAKAFLQVLLEAVMFPLSRITIDLTDDEVGWAPVPNAKGIDWTPTGHDPRSDPFTTIGWRWQHFTQELAAVAGSPWCLGATGAVDPEPPRITDASTAIDCLVRSIRSAAFAIVDVSDERLEELTDSDFGVNTRRHWVALMLMEAVHHAAEIGVLRDLYARTTSPR